MNEVTTKPATSLVVRFAQKYGVDETKLLSTLKQTVFRQKPGEEITNEQLMMLLQVSEEHNLNPLSREIYAFPDKGGIVAVVSIDGWLRIMNEHPALESIDFRYPEQYREELVKGRLIYDWVEVIVTRTDRATPIVVREFYDECYRDTGPWNSHPKRMLRHKALIQAARVAFGFAGIVDEDDGEFLRERDMGQVEIVQPKPAKPAPIAQGVAPAPTPAPAPARAAKAPKPRPASTPTPVAEPQAQGSFDDKQESETSAPPASAPATGADAYPADDADKEFLRKRMANLGVDEGEVLERAGISDFDSLTADGFIAIQEVLREIMRSAN